MTKFSQFAIFCLIVVAVFDPADLMTHAKVPLFIAAGALSIFSFLVDRGVNSPAFPIPLAVHVGVLAVVIPLLSICRYCFIGNGSMELYDGAMYAKAFLFATLAIPLALTRFRVMKPLVWTLTALSAMAVTASTMVALIPSLASTLWSIQDSSGLYGVGRRQYGGFSYMAVYFHTSPLLVIPIAYFTYLALTSQKNRSRYGLVAALNCVGMMCCGTRNDIFASILVPALIVLWYGSGRKKFWAGAMLSVGAVGVILFALPIVAAMFSPDEYSNALKLAHFKDYLQLFQDPMTLILGQGLGAYFNSTMRGWTRVTELSYFDIWRMLGILSVPFLAGILYPLTALSNKHAGSRHWLYLAYGMYLVLCFSNPFLLSSTGMLLFAVVISEFYSSHQHDITTVQPA